ncbi:DUF397 domain-containing protein [Actinophytocola sediminis]
MEYTAATWRKSSRSGSHSDCVEVHPAGAVRDSKAPGAGVLRVDLGALVGAVKGQRFSS